MELRIYSRQTVRMESVAPSSKFSALLFFALCVACATTQGFAANAREPLDISLTAERVIVDRDGKETLTDEGASRPGDLVQYSARYRNIGENRLENLVPTIPIPNGTEFIPQTDQLPPTMASLDGKTFEAVPIYRANSTGAKQIMPPSAYRAVRWPALPLDPHMERTVTARVRLLSNPLLVKP